METPRKMEAHTFDTVNGTIEAIPSRRLREDTCRKFGYAVGRKDGKAVQVANYYEPSGSLIGQKVRKPKKEFYVLGDISTSLFGRDVWKEGGRRIVVTEGEIDALSVSQAQDNKWPVVSIPNGASGAKKALAANLDWLLTFDEVVLCFDNDDPGHKAVRECVGIFPPGRVKVASLPLKDASEMLQKGKEGELVKCLWDAKVYRPEGIVTIQDIKADVLKPISIGFEWCLPTLSKETYGRRFGEVAILGAGTGVGKSTFLTQQIAFDIDYGFRVGVFALEQQPKETLLRVVGQRNKRVLHVPDSGVSTKELEKYISDPKLENLYLFNHFGTCDWDSIRDIIRFLVHSTGTRIFFIDHLTALAAAHDDEKKALEKIMAEVGGLVKELDCWILLVSHLSTPDGAAHEEGGRVLIKQFKGSRAIGYWGHFMFGLERDQQSDDAEERERTVFRVLKDRYTGRSTGLTIPLSYSRETGLFFESSTPFDGMEF